MVNANLYFTFAQKFSINSVFDNVSNLTQPEKTLDDDYKFSQGKYESDQINEIIYRLYEDYLHSDKNEFSHYQDIGVLIDNKHKTNYFYKTKIPVCHCSFCPTRTRCLRCRGLNVPDLGTVRVLSR